MQFEERTPWSTVSLNGPSRGIIPLDQSELISQSAASDVTIAPWLAPPQDPPSPPSPPVKKSSKASSFSLKPMASQTSLFSRTTRGTSEGTLPEVPLPPPSNAADPRRTNKFFGIPLMRRKASKPNLNKDSPSYDQASSSQSTLLSLYPLPSSGPREPTSPTRKKRKKTKGGPPPVPPKDDQEQPLTIDADFSQIGNIIDFTAARNAAPTMAEPRTSFTRNSMEENPWDDIGPLAVGSEYRNGIEDQEPGPLSTGQSVIVNGQRTGNSTFINPFAAQTVAPSSRKRKANHETLTLPLPGATTRSASSHLSHGDEHGPEWVAPQSWVIPGAVEESADYSSSDESISSPVPVPLQRDREASLKYKSSNNAIGQPPNGTDGPLSSSLPERALYGRPPATRPSTARPGTATGRDVYHIRVYRLDGSYHVVSCQYEKTVADLQLVLAKKLVLIRDQYRLFLRERGRERPLALNKRPIDILRRSLSHAGYEESDWRENLGGEDFSYLLRFVFRSAALGHVQDDELALDSFEHIDLTGRGLQTIPIILHHHSPTIATLNLSKNPMVEIPLDFIQSCDNLRDLRLSHVSLKRVPMSIRHSMSLNRLDISCNRIIDVEDAGLHLIPHLTTLNLQNNRLENLPGDFALLKNLKFLNISNNKFERFPEVLCEVMALVDLDLSFNSISTLPTRIGKLKQLAKLIIIGNRFTSFPPQVSELDGLRILDCRRNAIGDVSMVSMLPSLETLLAEHNVIHVLDLSSGPSLRHLDVSHNSITRLNVNEVNLSNGSRCNSLTSLDLSHAKLSSFDELAMSQLVSLKKLRLDYNQFRTFPDSLGNLSALTHFSCTDNNLATLPESIGQLQNLEELNVHNNNLKEIPASIWQCRSLVTLNATSNLIGVFHDPPAFVIPSVSTPVVDGVSVLGRERKGSGSTTLLPPAAPLPRLAPPLAQSLQRLYLGDNRLNDDVFPPLTVLKELRILNLSFNQLQEIPPFWLQALTQLEELYLSGNKLTSLPAEDLHRLQSLTTLFLNGNKLLTLPAELGKIKALQVLDVGSNMLKYNINNWEFDWNWNFNPHLKYLNLSGNKRLEIKPDTTHRSALALPKKQNLAEFSGLSQLRVLGLMDVTTLFIPSVPDENEDRRVRTSFSEVNGMAYGIADTLGSLEHLSMFDLVVPHFRSKDNECLFGMFGRAEAVASSNRLTRYLHENFTSTFIAALKGLNTDLGEGVGDALRRAFLSLNKTLYDYLNPPLNGRKMSHVSASTGGAAAPAVGGSSTGTDPVLKSGASGIVVYVVERTMYVANAGNSLAVVSRQGSAHLLSKKHEPFDRAETARIRAAEGWVSLKGKVNDEVDVSRSFGMYHLLPAVNSCPNISEWALSDQDEFVIVGNRGIWDYVSYQTAVDIARTSRDDPMIAAQKLRDFAISYGADGSTMVMVIAVGDLFAPRVPRNMRPSTADGAGVPQPSFYNIKRPLHPKRPNNIDDAKLARLPPEVPPPTGHLALVFTDIRNSTSLWEKNAGMSTAMRLHNTMLRRQLRIIGGYEVKTEGDSFMVSFHSPMAALLWCTTVQTQLMREDWPLEILECEDGQEISDDDGYLIARGLSVRMGIHWGNPVCEPDPVTGRMDYFGPMVNRSARIMANAKGGQIMVSQDVVKEIIAKGLLEENNSEDAPHANAAPTAPDPNDVLDMQSILEMIRRTNLRLIEVGEVKMKGLEIPELLTLVYPREIFGRKDLQEPGSDLVGGGGSRVTFSIGQIRELGMLCLRLEALASERVFKPVERKGSTTTMVPPRDLDQGDGTGDEEPPEKSVILHADPYLLMPPISDKASDAELLLALDSLSGRIENALSSLAVRKILGQVGAAGGQLDGINIQQLLHLLQRTI